jgi:nucleotide-binding universal stress UspA family protein
MTSSTEGSNAVFKSIVVGSDGSHTSNLAVRRAAELAKTCGAQLHIVNVCKPAGTVMAAPEAMAMAAALQVGEDAQRQAAQELERASHIATAEGVKVETHGRIGDPATVILHVAEDNNADLIVLGNRGMKGARRLLGSVPNAIAHRADSAVMIVPTF